MSNKITLPQLAATIAELTSSNSATAETFLKSLFELISETLLAGESVTIKGIGTFAPTHDPEHPILWTPDNELAETVNQPFAFFEPVELSEDVTEETLSEIQQTSEPDESDETLIIPEIPNDEDDTVDPAEIPPIPPLLPPPIPMIQPEIEIPEPESEANPEESEQKPEIEEPKLPDYIDFDDDEPRGRKYLPWFTLILGFVLGFAAKFAVDYFMPDPQTIPSTAEDSAVVSDTVAAPTDTVEKVDSVIDTVPVPAAPAEKPVIIDTVTANCYLTTLARRYYGDYKFWVYIYEENADKIADPNRIKPGTKVVIPDAEKYGIDASNPESIKRAEAKIAEIKGAKVK
jgi:hypothetical protein